MRTHCIDLIAIWKQAACVQTGSGKLSQSDWFSAGASRQGEPFQDGNRAEL